jgi:hypothetical protein
MSRLGFAINDQPYIVEMHSNYLRLVTILTWGLCLPAVAQAPSFSLPPIPGTAPQIQTATPAIPPLPLPASETPKAIVKSAPPAQIPEELPQDPLAPPLPDPAAGLPTPEAPKEMAGPPLPPTLSSEPLGPPLPENITSTVEVGGDPLPATIDDSPKKSWEIPLAPAIIPKRTTFNYKYVMLPAGVYRAAYSPENAHLPIRYSGADYDRMLLQAAARNDINATRALLNFGRNVNANVNGTTPLTAARASGAGDTARLLMARGAY